MQVHKSILRKHLYNFDFESHVYQKIYELKKIIYRHCFMYLIWLHFIGNWFFYEAETTKHCPLAGS